MKFSYMLILSLVVTGALFTYMALGSIAHVLPASSRPSVLSAQVGQEADFHPLPRTKTSGCTVRGALPDPECTPGAVFPRVTIENICTPGYSKSVRNVPERVKENVFAEYGITSRAPGEYEVDHLVSLELGGSNDIANLWPEPAEPVPGFHEKDTVENFLHQQVCDHVVSLSEAQKVIATDWLDIFHQMRD